MIGLTYVFYVFMELEHMNISKKQRLWHKMEKLPLRVMLLAIIEIEWKTWQKRNVLPSHMTLQWNVWMKIRIWHWRGPWQRYLSISELTEKYEGVEDFPSKAITPNRLAQWSCFRPI
jgi:hypothetical protein